MSIANDKALNLGGAKILYDDLRGRSDLKANYTDVFAGCTEYVPAPQASFETNTWYHEQGTAYICRLKSDEPGVAASFSGQVQVGSDGTVTLPYHLPTATNNRFYVYSLVDYIEARIASLIDDTAGDGDTEKAYSADKIVDLIASCLTTSSFLEYFIENTLEIPCRTSGTQFVFNKTTNKVAHERGTAYLCEYIGGMATYTLYANQSFPTESDSNFNVYTVWGYIKSITDKLEETKATKNVPVFTGNIRLGAAGQVGNGAICVGNNVYAYGRNSSVFGSYTRAIFKDQHTTGRYNTYEEKDTKSKYSNYQYKVNQLLDIGDGTYYICIQKHTSPNNTTWNPAEDPTHWEPYYGEAEVVGNGTDDEHRSNARVLDWDGNEELAGTFKCQTSITIGSTTITEAQLQALLATLN